MNNSIEKLFSCKYEELAPIGKFLLFGLRRDLTEFSVFSSKFDDVYANETETKITNVENLVDPKSETLAKSLITNRMNETLAGLSEPIGKVDGYLKLAKPALGITASAFGISELRRKINAKDVEAVVKQLSSLLANISKYKDALAAQGLTDQVTEVLNTLLTSLKNDSLERYEILSNRRLTVQNNIGVLNDLYARITEIAAIGKILYKKDPVKLSEYTFSSLLKKVRQIEKSKKEETESSATTTNS